MDPEIGRTVVIGIAAVGFAAWFAGAMVLLGAAREIRARAREAAEPFDLGIDLPDGALVGELEVKGQPEELSAKIASTLARQGAGPFGPVKILSADPREVTFEPAGPITASRENPGGGFRRARFRLKGSGSQTRIEYAIETTSTRARVLLACGWLFSVLGLIAIVAGLWLMFTWVLPSPHPSVRGGAVQMIQIIHFIWPPFLFAFLARQPARMYRTWVEALVHNLPYA